MATAPAQLEEITVSAPFFVICLLFLSFFLPCSLFYISFPFSVLCLLAKCRHCLLGEKNTKKEMDRGTFICNSRKMIPDSSTIECMCVCVCVQEIAFYVGVSGYSFSKTAAEVG